MWERRDGFIGFVAGHLSYRQRRTVTCCTPLVDALGDESTAVRAAFFCPGHKRGHGAPLSMVELMGSGVFRVDLPELPSLDNLFAPTGVIQEAESKAAEAFGAKRTFFLANGSTSGVIASVVASINSEKRDIVLPRNVHQSAVHALVVSGANGVFIPPLYSPSEDVLHGVVLETVKEVLERSPTGSVAAIFVVSPTYHGVVSDIKALSNLAHQHGAALIVDEAHGAHFGFHENLPTPALSLGADVVIQSTHKTLGSLTQSAMLHLAQESKVNEADLQAALQLVQSTSPSYLLLASLDAARDQAARQGRQIYSRVIALADDARRKIDAIEGLEVMKKPEMMTDMDPTRITVLLRGLVCDGYELDEVLIGEHGVYAELPATSHITFIFSVGTVEEDVRMLIDALKIATSRQRKVSTEDVSPSSTALLPGQLPFGEMVTTARTAFFSPKEQVPLEESIDRVCAVPVCPYPPGIPVLLPGERIDRKCVDFLLRVLAAGAEVTGCDNGSINCMK